MAQLVCDREALKSFAIDVRRVANCEGIADMQEQARNAGVGRLRQNVDILRTRDGERIDGKGCIAMLAGYALYVGRLVALA